MSNDIIGNHHMKVTRLVYNFDIFTIEIKATRYVIVHLTVNGKNKDRLSWIFAHLGICCIQLTSFMHDTRHTTNWIEISEEASTGREYQTYRVAG